MADTLSTTVAATPAEDLAVVREMANELQDYLLGEEVYYTLLVVTSQGEERIQSSCGDLLARLHKLAGQSKLLPPAQLDELSSIHRRIDATTKTMQARFLALILREVRARLNSLQWYLDDCDEDRRQCRVQFPFEIRNRQRIAELVKALGDKQPTDIQAEIAATDRRLRETTVSADFVWDKRVKEVYPREEYWYLYVLPTL
ncbi:MAG: hypothetical protein DWI57_05260 [Chloroflexi bacterium]|nr:MAG: hypothetical protein DWI57_05260 [Chloroflexota bacterium]